MKKTQIKQYNSEIKGLNKAQLVIDAFNDVRISFAIEGIRFSDEEFEKIKLEVRNKK